MSAPTDRPTEDPLGLTILSAPTYQPIGDPQDTAHTDNPTDDPISDPLGPLISVPPLDPSAPSDDPQQTLRLFQPDDVRDRDPHVSVQAT